ncbi:hypothetical protein ACCO45_006933 [Purpureocillium lilacinum]|uniref:Uncharacterized protein n=1 Tax=Purpureocillium lilacinum TaxID=33203 RepID=A0ACC4DQX2_PURLI
MRPHSYSVSRAAQSSPPPAGAVEEVRSRSVAGLTANSGTAGVTHSRADRAGSAPPLPPVPPQAAAPPVQDGMECEGPRRLGPSLGSEGHTDGAHPQTSPGATANSQQDASTTATGTSQDAAAHILDQDHQRKPENECASLAATL